MIGDCSSLRACSTTSLELVTIRIGKDLIEIPVYRELFSSVSPYFRNAFDGSFKEATDGTIPLPDITEATFRTFLQWAHAQLHSSSRLADVPDRSILPRNPSSEAHADLASNEPGASINTEDGSDESDGTEADDTGSNSSSSESVGDSEALSEAKAFDESDYMCLPDGSMYFDDEIWIKHFNMSSISYLNLYVFADKYSVHQLRDDIMTAIHG